MLVVCTAAAVSNSEYYSGFDPQDISVVTKSRRTGYCSATGDPHYSTFDGASFHELGPGRMVFYKSLVRDFEIQTRVYSRPALFCGIAAH